MQALLDYVFIKGEPKATEAPSTGLYVPETKKARGSFEEGEVISVGELVTTILAGDTVLYSAKASEEIDTEEGSIYLMKAEAVVAKLS